MAGTIIVSSIKTDTDNSFIVRSNTGATLFSVDTTSISIPDGSITSAMIANGTVIAADILDGTITDAKITAVANTKVTGLITAGQIASVANTQITGNITSSQITSIQSSSLPTGSVLQVVYASSNTAAVTTSSSYVATPLTATINKLFSSSKILILFCPNVQAYGLNIADARAGGMLYDTTNSRQIIDYNCINRSYGSGGITHTSAPNLGLQAYDTNSGTGSRQYTFYMKMIFGSGININLDTNGDATSTMVLMEIA